MNSSLIFLFLKEYKQVINQVQNGRFETGKKHLKLCWKYQQLIEDEELRDDLWFSTAALQEVTYQDPSRELYECRKELNHYINKILSPKEKEKLLNL